MHDGKKYGRNDDNKNFIDLENRNFYKSVPKLPKIDMLGRVGLFAAGTALIIGTTITLSSGSDMIIKAFGP